MAKNTLIEYVHHTVNFWWGCAFKYLLDDGSLSEECRNCYALAMSRVFSRGRATWGAGGKRWIRVIPAMVELQKHDVAARKAGVRRRVFINSMSDTFEDHPDLNQIRITALQACEQATHLDILLLTKRPENILRMVPANWTTRWPAHVWIGTTAGTRKSLGDRASFLLKVPAPVRFFSVEPLLEDLGNISRPPPWKSSHIYKPIIGADGISWVICGGESGPRARPMHPDWARSLRDQCQSAGVPFFFKQWGEWAPCDAEFATHCMTLDGQVTDLRKSDDFPLGAVGIARLGKHASARLLDGVEHAALPS